MQLDLTLRTVGARYADDVVRILLDRAEILVLHGIREERCHVARGGVQLPGPLAVVEPVWVGVHGMREPQLGCLLVHGVHEGLVRVSARGVDERAHAGSDGDGGIVARGDHETLERLGERHGVALGEVRRGLAHRRRHMVNGDGIRELGVLERHHGGHDLGDRGDLDLGIRIALKVDGAILANHDGVAAGQVGGVRLRDARIRNRLTADDIRSQPLRERRRRHGERQGDCRGKGDEEAMQTRCQQRPSFERGRNEGDYSRARRRLRRPARAQTKAQRRRYPNI